MRVILHLIDWSALRPASGARSLTFVLLQSIDWSALHVGERREVADLRLPSKRSIGALLGQQATRGRRAAFANN